MMIVLLLLGSCFCLGLSYDEEEYGSTLRMKLQRRTESIEFTSERYSVVKILWNRDDPPDRENSRGRVIGSYYVIYNLTQQDSGRYVMRDKDRSALYVRSIHVEATTRSYAKKNGETLGFTFNLEPNSCNIYFFPENDHLSGEIEIVRQGRLIYWNDLDCEGFDLIKPCGIRNEHLQTPCSGRFEIRDSKGNVALDVSLEVESTSYSTSEIGIGIGVFFAVLSCCTCMRRCCCGKSSSKKDQSESPDTEPAVHYQENDNEPVRPSAEQLGPPSRTHYPARPSHTPTEPLIHRPPTNAPPPYSEVPAPADAPTVPVPSEPEPRYELKGMTFPSLYPLGSDSTCNDVYTSEKLNFL